MHNSLELLSLDILRAVAGVYFLYFVQVHFPLTQRVIQTSSIHSLSLYIHDHNPVNFLLYRLYFLRVSKISEEVARVSNSAQNKSPA